MKKFLVVLLACAMIFGFASTAFAADTQIKEFSDIADQSQVVKNAVMKLAILGVLEGNEGVGGPIRPADTLTRAEFAKIVCYLTGNVKTAEALANVASRFPDVSVGSWYTGWVNQAVQAGYFQGDTAGNFRPNANITENEVVTVVLRAMGYNDKLPGVWPTQYAYKASNIGILDDVIFTGSPASTRATAFVICDAVLGKHMVVHISNDIAFAMALSDGTVDKDGFAEVYYMSNEDEGIAANQNEKQQKLAETILHKAFKCVEVKNVFFNRASSTAFDETTAWGYVDFKEGELQMLGYDFKDYEVAEKYYINKEFTLPELAYMQANVVVDVDVTPNEVKFVNVKGSYINANDIYREDTGRINADGKSYRQSPKTPDGYDFVDLTNDGDFAFAKSDKDNTYPGKVYLDKDGMVVAVKNYEVFNNFGFGVFDEIAENLVEYKDEQFFTPANTAVSGADRKLDVTKDYILIKDNKFIKAEDLEEFDAVYYLGQTNGNVRTFLAYPALEGTMSNQNKTSASGNGKLTISDKALAGVGHFTYSDDGGDNWDAKLISALDIDSAAFSDVLYTKGYNWGRLAFVAANNQTSKIIGVVTKIEPVQMYNGAAFQAQYQEITIFNAEGKEVKYTFHKDFKNIYNMFLVDPTFAANLGENLGTFAHAAYADQATALAAWNAVAGQTGNAAPASTYPNKGEAIRTTGIAKGDIVQLTVDKSDQVKKISNYAQYSWTNAIANNYSKFKVKASTDQVSISTTGNVLPVPVGGVPVIHKGANGAFTLPSEATVFCVTTTAAGAYDDVKLVKVADVMAADFNAHKGVAFDVKSNGALNALYYVGDVSNVRVGVINSRNTNSTNTYYRINDQVVYSDDMSISALPALVYYTVSGGDVFISGAPLVHNSGAGALTPAIRNAGDYNAVSGNVSGYYSGTTFVVVGGSNYRVTKDTYIYDMVKKDVTDVGELKGNNVVVVYDNTSFEAAAIVIYNKPGTTPPPVINAAYLGEWIADVDFGTPVGNLTDSILVTFVGAATNVNKNDFSATVNGVDVPILSITDMGANVWEVTLDTAESIDNYRVNLTYTGTTLEVASGSPLGNVVAKFTARVGAPNLVVVPTHTYAAPAPVTVNGVTATITFAPASPQKAFTDITATVTLTDAGAGAVAAGTFTVNLATVGYTGTPTTTPNVAIGGMPPVTTYTYIFTMPTQDLAAADFTLTFTSQP